MTGRCAISAASSGSTGSPTIRAFASNADRVDNRAAFIALVEAATQKFSAAPLLGGARRKPLCRRGRSIRSREVFADPQVVARAMRIDLPATGAAGGTVPSVRTPIMIDGEAMAAATAAPRLGEHTRRACSASLG